jgi:hypothetical protein
MPAHISYVQFKQHLCACHTCTECEPECSRLCVCSTASAGRYCYVLRNSWLLTTVRKMQRVGEQLQSHNHTDQTYVTREPHIIIHLRYTPPYTHIWNSLTHTSALKPAHKPVHISTQTSTHQYTNQYTSAHISTHHYLISTHQYTNQYTSAHISTHQHTSAHIIILSVHIIILSVHIWNSLTHTNQYTSLSYQYTSVHKSVHISTHQYKSVQISTHQYKSVHISTRTHIHARKTHTTSFPPTDIHPLNTHTYTSTYTSPQTQ